MAGPLAAMRMGLGKSRKASNTAWLLIRIRLWSFLIKKTMITLDQSEISSQVTRLIWTNQMQVARSCDYSDL